MGKYIIEVKDGETLYKAVIAPDGEPYITPAMGNVYTEPDMENVREEAKEEGYSIGYDEGREAGVQQGLSDAWEAARKISSMNSLTRDEVFGLVITSNIFDENTASEAIEKIRQYEQEKDRQARIEYNFDEIKDVLETTVKECNVSLDEIAAVLQKMREEWA